VEALCPPEAGRRRHDVLTRVSGCFSLRAHGSAEARPRDSRQFEAVETLIWLTEGPAADRQGLDIPDDGGAFPRLCAKMATGSGKTLVMAMVIAWHVLNRVANPEDARFSKPSSWWRPGSR
jgi:hypothetical protein